MTEMSPFPRRSVQPSRCSDHKRVGQVYWGRLPAQLMVARCVPSRCDLTPSARSYRSAEPSCGLFRYGRFSVFSPSPPLARIPALRRAHCPRPVSVLDRSARASRGSKSRTRLPTPEFRAGLSTANGRNRWETGSCLRMIPLPPGLELEANLKLDLASV